MLSLLTPEGATRHVAVVPFLRLTNDKSFYSQQEILAVWQFLILTDRNSEEQNSFVPPQLPKWPEGRRRSSGGGKAATFYQCSLNWPACRVNVCLPSVYLKRKCSIKMETIYHAFLQFIIRYLYYHFTEVGKVAKWPLKGINLKQLGWAERANVSAAPM